MNFNILLLSVQISYLFKLFFNCLIDFAGILACGIHEMRNSAIYDVIHDILQDVFHDVKHDVIYDVIKCYVKTNDVKTAEYMT